MEGSAAGSDRDSDMEFEQMLADAEETPGAEGTNNKTNVEESGVEPPAEPPVRRKAKTKIGNKTKKKKKTKTTSKFPDGEEGLQVELRSICLCVRCFKCALIQITQIYHIIILIISLEIYL